MKWTQIISSSNGYRHLYKIHNCFSIVQIEIKSSIYNQSTDWTKNVSSAPRRKSKNPTVVLRGKLLRDCGSRQSGHYYGQITEVQFFIQMYSDNAKNGKQSSWAKEEVSFQFTQKKLKEMYCYSLRSRTGSSLRLKRKCETAS